MVKRTDEEYRKILLEGKYVWLNIDDLKWIDANVSANDSQFERDLIEKGKPREERVLAYIQKWDKKAYMIDGYDSEKDIVAPTINKTFEVKSCEDAIKNVPIEISITNKNGTHQSGLSVTKADYWVIFCKGKYHAIFVDVLIELVRDIEPKEYEIHDQKVVLKIMPIEFLQKYSQHIWSE